MTTLTFRLPTGETLFVWELPKLPEVSKPQKRPLRQAHPGYDPCPYCLEGLVNDHYCSACRGTGYLQNDDPKDLDV